MDYKCECGKTFKNFSNFAKHKYYACETNDSKALFKEQEKIAIDLLNSGKSQYEAKKLGFVLGHKRLWKIWRSYFSELEIKQKRHKARYVTFKQKHRKTFYKEFICIKCGSR